MPSTTPSFDRDTHTVPGPPTTRHTNPGKVKALLREGSNSSCFSCRAKYPTYVVTDVAVFVCSNCAGILREFAFRVKNVTMSTFTESELEKLAAGGNANGMFTWLGKWSSESFPKPGPGDTEGVRAFIVKIFLDKYWYNESSFEGPTQLPHQDVHGGAATPDGSVYMQRVSIEETMRKVQEAHDEDERRENWNTLMNVASAVSVAVAVSGIILFTLRRR
eukprot:GFYU01009330.1.p1 GENE.GFYU01009330.1~~GFYU01009330.1.p1  ORF type:complete len:219 (-),score=32.26 GFYU01009330.1:341-997(-)